MRGTAATVRAAGQWRRRVTRLRLGVGLAVGPAIVGRLAGGANVSVLGEATNLASRLQGHAAAGFAVPRELTLKGFDVPVVGYGVSCMP